MGTNALWALAALATLFVLFFSLEIYVPVWQFLRLSVFGSLGRFLLFLILGTVATYGAYWAFRGYSPTQTTPQPAVPQIKELTQNGRDTRGKGSHARKSRRATGGQSTSSSEAAVQGPQK